MIDTTIIEVQITAIKQIYSLVAYLWSVRMRTS